MMNADGSLSPFIPPRSGPAPGCPTLIPAPTAADAVFVLMAIAACSRPESGPDPTGRLAIINRMAEVALRGMAADHRNLAPSDLPKTVTIDGGTVAMIGVADAAPGERFRVTVDLDTIG